MPDRRDVRLFLYLAFTLSGATGLVYESLWVHYLKLLLGHAAYAQALVLISFMGGLAVGPRGVEAACSERAARFREWILEEAQAIAAEPGASSLQ